MGQRYGQDVRILASVVLAVGLVAAPQAAQAATTNRLAGPDRYATAAAIAVDRFPSASDAVIARADDPADALGGSYVAGSHGSPVLLAEPQRVPQATLDVLQSRGVHKIRLLGGPGALGPEVAEQLVAAGYTVVRIAGADRYATAALVARDSGEANIGVYSGRGRTVLLANGSRPADALTAGPLAFGQQWPVLLSTTDSIPAVTRQALDDLAISHIVVVGGTAAVSDAVLDELRASGRTVERVAGADREQTATAVADLLIGIGEALVRVEVAAASSFADALALGPHAAPAAPILLCRSRDDCGATTLSWIARHSATVETVVIAGGTGVISELAATQLRVAAGA